MSKETEFTSLKCLEFLVELVNTEPVRDAWYNFLGNVRKKFDFSYFVGREGRRISEKDQINVEKNRELLKQLFQEIEDGKNISKNALIQDYLLCYFMCCRSQVYIDDDGRLYSLPVLDEGAEFDQIFAYCLVNFLMSDKNRKLIHSCKKCEIFFISKRAGDNKFCSDKCRIKFNNRKRIESGESKEYKRKKRADGASSGYYG